MILIIQEIQQNLLTTYYSFDIITLEITKKEVIKMDTLIEKIKKISPSEWAKQNPKAKKEIKKLMKKYATAYYEGNALITDLDFDVLVDSLKLLSPKDKYLTTPGWGYKIKNGSKHLYGKIGTLSYYYDYLELTNIFDKNEEVIITPKFDGINFAAYSKTGS